MNFYFLFPKLYTYKMCDKVLVMKMILIQYFFSFFPVTHIFFRKKAQAKKNKNKPFY